MNTAELREQEIAAAEEQAQQAAQEQAHPLERSTVTAATKALAAVYRDDKRGGVAEPAADLRDLRTDADLQKSLGSDLVAVGGYLRETIPQWIANGWLAEAEGQAQILGENAPALVLSVELTDTDRADLADFPVQGHRAEEIAAHLVQVLHYAFDGALGQVLNAAAEPADLPALLAEVERSHAQRVATIAREAYFAGAQAARVDVGAALTGAA